MVKGIILYSVGIAFVYVMAKAAAPQTREEQEYRDREQTEYLERWYKEHRK